VLGEVPPDLVPEGSRRVLVGGVDERVKVIIGDVAPRSSRSR
jgi:hypothetical protein